jgi:hypothetical protein
LGALFFFARSSPPPARPTGGHDVAPIGVRDLGGALAHIMNFDSTTNERRVWACGVPDKMWMSIPGVFTAMP